MSFISCSFDMTMYENRLKSFDSGWYISFITPSQMAKAGFYYLGLHDRVRCMYCAKEFDYWKHGDDPSIRHKSISPECSFFDENNDSSSYSQFESADPESPTMSFVTSSSDMTIYENRLESFYCGWHLSFITPSQMANIGFYYLGVHDRVKCIYCAKEFDCWKYGDNPSIKHRHISPKCSFIDENNDFSVCGHYHSFPTVINPKKHANEIQRLLGPMGIVHQINSPRYAEHTAFETRLKTFDYCQKKLKLDIHVLCEAGFYYTGDGQNDQVSCFYCNKGLKDWEDEDEPWTEHARWSPKCNYVLLSKGKHFVDAVCGVKNDIPTKIKEEKLMKMIADISIPGENNIEDNSTNRNHDQPEIIDSNQVKTLSEINVRNTVQHQQQRDLSIMPDSMLCKICYREEMTVAFIPCGHVIACIQCAMTLDECALCRQEFIMVMRVYVSVDEDLKQLPCSSSQCSNESLELMLCKVCHKEEMQAVFIPCRHIHACIKCAIEMHECPVCSEVFCSIMQIYL